MSEQQPEYIWVHPPERPRRGRVWVVVGLVVAAVVIAAAVFWLFLRPGTGEAEPEPTASASPSVSATPTTTKTPSPSPDPSASSAPEDPATEPPAPQDPSLAVFRDKVSPVLGDAARGLQIADGSDPQQAAETIGLLQEDAGRLADTIAPDSIAADWRSALDGYVSALQKLRTAYEQGGSADGESAAARRALDRLSSLIG
ncbi:hypothetical protein [Microbacterium soli]|uniref:Uncharacterized protein n=1 Tax=Microbacterium soli TaxID=446075 RepID=A0ABP7MNW7_9MICO